MQTESDGARYSDLVRQIAAGDASGVEQLYRELRRLIRGKFLANFSRISDGYSFEDSLHETLLIVLEAIRTGQLRDPERLPGFVRTVARRQAVAKIRTITAGRKRMWVPVEIRSPLTPEARLSGMERSASLRDALDRLSLRDREILERFYLKEQPAGQICAEMQLTGTQFRLYKSRAIAKCSHLIVTRPAEKRPFSRPAPAELHIA
jgi:RNA polymerase sigma-70 factor, ECF subfamily